jgi:predicted enzyme related to lactoylglutathione lyase
MANRVVHFEIHATHPQRAIQFYSSLFGWRFDRWDGLAGYWLITTGDSHQPGINGGLIARTAAALPATPPCANAFVCTVSVDDIDLCIAKAVKLGGQIVQAKLPIHDTGWLSYLQDTEGNTFGLIEQDSAAI